jgi:hypothetical protein
MTTKQICRKVTVGLPHCLLLKSGRLEYDIEGTQFVVHLKDAEKVQRGKRWSQGRAKKSFLEKYVLNFILIFDIKILLRF